MVCHSVEEKKVHIEQLLQRCAVKIVPRSFTERVTNWDSTEKLGKLGEFTSTAEEIREQLRIQDV